MRDLGLESPGSLRAPSGRPASVLLLDRRRPRLHGLFGGDGGSLQLLGVGALLALIAMIVLGPTIGPPLAAVLGAPLPKLLGVDGRMARENALRNPKRTASTASAVMVGVALVGFIAVTAQSVKASTSAAIDASVKGQYVITSDGFGPTALPSSVGRAGAGPARGAGRRRAAGPSPPSTAPTGSSWPPTPAQLTQLIDINDVAGSLTAPRRERGRHHREDRRREGASRSGQQVTATFLGSGTRQLTIEAIYDTRFPIRGSGMARHPGAVRRQRPAGPADRLGRLHRAGRRLDGRHRRRPAALQAIADAVPGAELQDVGEYQRAQTSQADQFLLVVYVLLALALVIAIVGVVNTLLLSVTERTRELRPAAGRGHDPPPGALEHPVGVADHRLRRHDHRPRPRPGLRLGARALAEGRRHHRLRDPVAATWSLIVELTILAGIGAATYPAWRASRLDVLDAIATE